MVGSKGDKLLGSRPIIEGTAVSEGSIPKNNKNTKMVKFKTESP